MSSYVYLIHFNGPIHHAKHYLGYTSLENVIDRYNRHKSSQGSKLLAYANTIGISYCVVRIWECDTTQAAKALERKLKHMKNSPRLCPVCNKTAIGWCELVRLQPKIIPF